jgi:hypothetical protein
MLAFKKLIAGNKTEILELENQLQSLKENLAISEYLKTFSLERQSFLSDFIEKCGNIPSKFKNKYLGEYSKQISIFKGRAEEWQKEINDPAKYEKLALLALNKLPAFKSFMQENGELSRLFGNPSSAISNISGLQTRSNLVQAMQQRGFTPGNYGSLVQSQIQSAQTELNKAKENLANLERGETGNGNSDIPGTSTYNTQKTKPFRKRLEFGIDFQSGIRQYQFPSSNAIAISAGYKWHDRLTTGLGLAYKFSLGCSFKEIKYSHNGISLRSFFEYKLSKPRKGIRALFSNIWIASAFEMNYWSAFKQIPDLKNEQWQSSVPMGISKKIVFKKKFCKIQVLYDLLANPANHQGFIYRFGYQF